MAETAGNLYADLLAALKSFFNFIDPHMGELTAAVKVLKPMVPQVTTLLTSLIDLLDSLKTEITNINLANVTDKLTTVAGFTASAKTLLVSVETLLPDKKPTVDQVLAAIATVGDLPSLDQVKSDILDFIGTIRGHLDTLKNA